MKGLKEICNEVKLRLGKLSFLEHVEVRFGVLERENRHYRAVYIFKPKNTKDVSKLKTMQQYLKSRQYKDIKLELEPYSVAELEEAKFWQLLLVSDLGKPAEQEETLIRALSSLEKDLAQYSLRR